MFQEGGKCGQGKTGVPYGKMMKNDGCWLASIFSWTNIYIYSTPQNHPKPIPSGNLT